MTIQAAVSEKAYAGDGITVVFPIPFPFDTAADLKLTSTDASGNILTLSTGFTISGGAGSTGNAIFSVAPIPGVTITICDNPALTQPTDYVSLDAFPAESHERALDRVTRIAKRLYQLIQRSVRFPDGDVSTDGVLGSVANRKGKYLFFNAVTGAIEYAANIVTTTLSQSVIGQLLFPQTPAEIAASAAPTNYAYAPWRGEDVRRFGAVGNGVADDRGALNTANTIGAALYFPPGTYLINSNLTLSVPLILEYGAKLKPASGVTITISNDVIAGFWQVFDYSAGGTVAGLKRSWGQWFGMTRGDGTTSESAALNNTLTATTGGTVLLPTPSVYYKSTLAITIPDNTVLCGDNKRTCEILIGANVDGITLGDGSQLYGLYIEGNATTGHGLQIPTGKGNQTIQNCRIINFDVGVAGGVLNYADNTAGSRLSMHDCEIWQTNGASGSGKFAVYVPDVFQAGAVPHKYSQIETAGKCSFFFGGCNDNFVSLSFVADLAFSTNSRGVQMVGNRIANQAALSIDGANHNILGNDFAPQITLAATLSNSVIGPNSYNLTPIIDNSPGNNSVSVFIFRQLYTPVMSNSGGNFALGNGTILGYYSRTGSSTTVWVNFTVGSTTVMGTTELRVTLPVSKQDGEVLTGGAGDIQAAAQHYTVTVQVPGNVAYMRFLWSRNDGVNSGVVTGSSPVAAFAAGDVIRFMMTIEP